MRVALLRGENFRLCRTLDVEPHPRLNLITGGNAAGKTTILEALFVGARGRSFRASSLSELCGAARSEWTVFMEVRDRERLDRLGVGWVKAGVETRLNEVGGVRRLDLVRALPLQLIDPGAHRLLEEGPGYRRSFVDWGVFHVEHRYPDVWRGFQDGLKQRNRALREGLSNRLVQAWDERLSEAATQLNAMREAHLEETRAGFGRWAEKLLGETGVGFEWKRGWSPEQSYRDVLTAGLEQHRNLGTTIQGPHRAELRIMMSDVRARGRVSRGQQKMLICAMVLAQAEALIRGGVGPPVLLLDDFSAELSAEFQARLAVALDDYPGQKFISAFEAPAAFLDRDTAMFHVEHGSVRRTQ